MSTTDGIVLHYHLNACYCPQVNLQLQVFSYLGAETLCKIAPTSHYWLMLSEDKVLWTNLLRDDTHRWKAIGHLTYPPTYTEANTELTPKQM